MKNVNTVTKKGSIMK